MDWAQFWIATLWVFNIFKSFKKKLAADHFSGLENKPNNCDVTIFQQQCRIFSKLSSVPFNLNAWPAYLLEEGDANILTVG